jgi:hypothetical protein
VIPLDESGCLDDANWVSYLVVQMKLGTVGPGAVENLVRQIPYVYVSEDDPTISNDATVSRVVARLQSEGVEVLSASIAQGLTWMKC